MNAGYSHITCPLSSLIFLKKFFKIALSEESEEVLKDFPPIIRKNLCKELKRTCAHYFDGRPCNNKQKESCQSFLYDRVSNE